MSHLRAPSARADRREGGRHGRPVARTAPAPAETHIRPQLLRLAVLPPTAVALSACAVVLFTVRSTGTRPGPVLWAVLAGAVAVTGVGILVAAVAADRAARSVSDRIAALRCSNARGEADLRALVETLRRGEVPDRRKGRGAPPADADDFELLAADLARAHEGAVTAVVQASQLSSQAGSEQKLEVFVNLARRLQSLVHREISILDELENEIEDPELLKGLFHVDHLATRIRRHAENLAVLGGAVSRRQWSNPVPMTEVLRSAIAEVEQYARVKLVPPIDGELRGHAVADVIHLLAELVENATVFSAPHTQVLLRANLVTSGLAVEVEDRGLGMPVEEQARMNALLADPDQVNVGRLLADGRIGLFVVSQLARRHGIRVRLQSNIYGGVQAVLVVPQAVLGGPAGAVVPARDPFPQDTAEGNARSGARSDRGPAPAAPARGPAPFGPVSGTRGADNPPALPQGRARGTGRQPLTPQGQGTGAVRPPVPSTAPSAAEGTARRPAPSRAQAQAQTRAWGGTDRPSVSSRPQTDGTPAGHPFTAPEARSTSDPTGSRVPTRLPSGPAGTDSARPRPTTEATRAGATSAETGATAQGRFASTAGSSPSPAPRDAAAVGEGTSPGRFGSGGGAGSSTAPVVPRDGAAGDGANVSGASAWSTDTGDVGGSALTARLRSLSDQGRSPGSAAAAGAPGGPSAGDAMAAAGHGAAGSAPLPVRGVGGPSVGDAAVAAGHGAAGSAPLPVRGVGGPSVGDAMAAAGHGAAGPAPLPVRGVGGPSVGDAMAAAGHGAAGPAPLPVRGARHERPNPAEAVPGIRRAERAVVEENAGLAPVPRNGPVRGTMGKPQLPRRRAQEHIAPQLRGGPAPRPDAEQPAAHDPGLMAAFQRGIGLAEAQQSLEAEVLESAVPFPEWEPLQHGSYQASDPVAPPDSRPPAAPPAPGPAHPRHPAARTAPGSPLRMTDGAGAPQGPGSGSEQPNPRHDGSAPAG